MEIEFAVVLATFFTLGILSLAFVVLVFYQRKRNEYHLNLERLKIQQKEEIIRKSIELQELERQKIGRELHDQSGPELAALKHNISMVKYLIKDKKWDEVDEQISQFNQHLQSTIERNRDVSHLLFPVVLKKHGLVKALEEMISKASKTYKSIRFSTDFRTQTILDDQWQTSIYRIAQELIANGTRHSKSNQIFLSLIENGNTLELTYTDRGVGFPPDIEKGLGLENIHFRASLNKGDVKITSNQDSGTHIQITYEINH